MARFATLQAGWAAVRHEALHPCPFFELQEVQVCDDVSKGGQKLVASAPSIALSAPVEEQPPWLKDGRHREKQKQQKRIKRCGVPWAAHALCGCAIEKQNKRNIEAKLRVSEKK